MTIDTVPLGRTTWLRMRRRPRTGPVPESCIPKLAGGEKVWIWDEETGHWREPALVDTF